MLKKHQKTFTYFRAMVSLNDSEIFLLYLDHGEDPDEFPLFFSTEPPPPYHIRVNWVRPRGGLLAMDYDEGNRIHTNNVQFVVTQLTNATIVLLRYAEDLLTRFHQGIKGEAFRSNQGGNPPHLQGPVLYDATLFKGRLQVAASDFKSHVQTFLNTVGYEIGMKHESTLVLLHDDVRSAVFSLQDEKAAATVASLKYQDLLAEPIKGRLFVCWFHMDIAEKAFSSIDRLSGDGENVPVRADDLEVKISEELSLLRAFREDLEDNPFSIDANMNPIQNSLSEDSIDI